MAEPTFLKSRLLLKTFLDSGAPPGSEDYTTVVIVHGWGFHAANFKKLLPLAHTRNLRVVLPNRRGYLGSAPFSSEELAALVKSVSAPPRSPEGVAGAEAAMKERAEELYDYLVHLVRSEHIPPAQGKNGGIVFVGWSLGTTHISSLLANVGNFAVGDVRLSDYIQRVVFYDGSNICFGYAPPEGLYEPLTDRSLPPEELVPAFNKWIGGYYSHGDVAVSGIGALEDRKALADPPPTTENMSAEEYQESTYDPPCAPNGSESLLAGATIMHGVLGPLKDGAFYLRDVPVGAEDWRSVEVRYVWCENSVWEMPFGYHLLSTELEEARKGGKKVRNVSFGLIRGANHFVHWDHPEKFLTAVLGDDSEVV